MAEPAAEMIRYGVTAERLGSMRVAGNAAPRHIALVTRNADFQL